MPHNFETPGKKRKKLSPKTDLPAYQKEDIRDMIYNFHKTENSRVSARKLKAKMENELGWSGSLSSAKRVVRSLGFRWRKTLDNRQLLVEKSDIRAWRISYIQKIRFFRNEGRP